MTNNAPVRPTLLRYDLGAGIEAFSTERKAKLTAVGAEEQAEEMPAEVSPYDGFNITHYCGDAPTHVAACRAGLCTALGIADEALVLPRQVHEARVLVVGADFLHADKQARTAALEGIDAVVTAERGICIGVSTADCVPILLADARTGAIAAIHAGWRSAVKRIAEKAVGTLSAQFGTQPADIRAVVGPHIKIASFEVGDEVFDAFAAARYPMERIARSMPARSGDGEKWHIDLTEAAALSLEAAGVPRTQIALSAIDTFETSQRFFSARRLGTASGRIFTGILRH